MKQLIRAPAAIVLVALSFFIAMVCNKQRSEVTEPATLPGSAVTAHQHVASANDGPDWTSLIQGPMKVQMGLLDGQFALPMATPAAQKQAVPQFSVGKSDANDTSSDSLKVKHRATEGEIGSAKLALMASWHSPVAAIALLDLSLVHRIHRAATKNVASIGLVFIIVVCLALSLYLVLTGVDGGRQRASTPSSANKDASAPSYFQSLLPAPRSLPALRTDSRLQSPQNSRTFTAPPPGDTDFGLRPWPPHTSPLGSLAQMLPKTSEALASHSSLQSRQDAVSTFDSMSQFGHKNLPPPLCPNVVLPNCLVRVGIPMNELGKISSEGELTIVGLSGNPLLRATVQKSEAGRTLAISMPEPRSAPRATIGPSLQDVAGTNKQKSRAVQIHGMKGAFYGMLEMHSSGACYVIKDGETVLVIDGDSESLQLSIKSGQGLPLANVTCSSEPFGGAEHLEVRVQPGVDTVLVLACVLAVVLLSPYSPSD